MLDPLRKRHLIRTIGIVIFGTFAYLGLNIVMVRLNKTPEKNAAGLPAQMIYNKNIICEDAWEHDLHHENDRDFPFRPTAPPGVLRWPDLSS